jgi:molybdenum cofactor cytidylyltransferase
MSHHRDEIGIVVLCAGDASRYGAAKLTLPIDGIAMARRAAMAAMQASNKVVVVTGSRRELIAPLVTDLDVEVTCNSDWALGMGRSIAHGVAYLRELAPSLAGVIVALGDQVRVGADEFAELVAAHVRLPDHIVAARYVGRLGAPCLFPRNYFDELCRLHGAAGAREILERHSGRVHEIAMPQAEFDVDTPADYACILSTKNGS